VGRWGASELQTFFFQINWSITHEVPLPSILEPHGEKKFTLPSLLQRRSTHPWCDGNKNSLAFLEPHTGKNALAFLERRTEKGTRFLGTAREKMHSLSWNRTGEITGKCLAEQMWLDFLLELSKKDFAGTKVRFFPCGSKKASVCFSHEVPRKRVHWFSRAVPRRVHSFAVCGSKTSAFSPCAVPRRRVFPVRFQDECIFFPCAVPRKRVHFFPVRGSKKASALFSRARFQESECIFPVCGPKKASAFFPCAVPRKQVHFFPVRGSKKARVCFFPCSVPRRRECVFFFQGVTELLNTPVGGVNARQLLKVRFLGPVLGAFGPVLGSFGD